MACRPKTLPAAVAPVLLGTAIALGDGGMHWPSAALAFLGAIAIQIGTNLANDYYDFKKGTDTAERTGPVRVTQAGLISPASVRLGFIFTFAIAAVIAFQLSLRGGWPILLIGATSIAAGILYTAGPKPLGYNGLGELFVFIFFGPVAVAGTYFVQTREINPAVILAGVAPGLISAAILVVNNLRDIETDRKANKRTLAVRFGPAFTQAQYFIFLCAAAFMPMIIYAVIQDRIQIFISSITLFFAIPAIRAVFSKTDGPSLNQALAHTGILLIIYCVLFSIGWVYADLRF